MLLVTLVSTTFAWFSLNDNSWVDDFEIGIENTDQLLIGTSSSNMKQFLSNEDLVSLINEKRATDAKINGLGDIKLTPVTSIDGEKFYRQVSVFDEKGKMSIEYKDALASSYIVFSLVFKVEPNGTQDEYTEHPDYELRFKTTGTTSTGLSKTNFSSEVQAIKLLNSLILKDGTSKESDDYINVNPVNALRVAVKGASNSDVDYIYDVSNENDLGSYAIYEELLNQLEIADDKFNCNKNAMFTYFNQLNNNSLKPLGYYSTETELEEQKKNIQGLLSRYKEDMNQSLGLFKYNKDTNEYNSLTVDIAIWIEGFDADNLIGLDTSTIDCLLSFDIKESLNEG